MIERDAKMPSFSVLQAELQEVEKRAQQGVTLS